MPENVNGKAQRPGRLTAWLALAAAVAVVVTLVLLIFRNVTALLLVLIALGIAGAAGWFAVTRRGAVRVLAVVCLVGALVGGAVAMIALGAIDELVAFCLAAAVFSFAARHALQAEATGVRDTARATTASRVSGRAVLLMNPKSGGGKVEKFNLVEEARRRGIETILLERGDDLRELAHRAAGSADIIGMAGGDGSQALVAQVAMEHDLPYVCVPAGTRNHLALDLGLDRDDVAGALDAFTSTRRASHRSRVRQRSHLRQQRLPRDLRGDRPVGRLSRREARDRRQDAARAARASSHALRSSLPRAGRRRTALDAAAARLQQSLRARPARRDGLPAAHGHGTARDRVGADRRRRRGGDAPLPRGARPGAAVPGLARMGGPRVRGRIRRAPSRPASTARAFCSSRRFASGSLRPRSPCACRRTRRASHPPRSVPG